MGVGHTDFLVPPLIFSFVCYMIPKSYRSFHVSSICMYSITFNCFTKFPRYVL